MSNLKGRDLEKLNEIVRDRKTQGDCEGQGDLACRSPCGCKELRRDKLLLRYSWAPVVAQILEDPPTMRETWVRSLSWEDSLEEGLGTPLVFLSGESPRTEEPGGLLSMGL